MRQTGMLDISVRNPHTYEKFTSFEVAIQTHNPAFSSQCSRTRRRYSEFCWLRKRLRAHHPLNTPPKLPSKATKLERSDPQFLVQRLKELEDWLYDVVDTALYLSDTALHLFLQTQLSCDQIDDYLAGKLPDSIREQAEKECSVETGGNGMPEDVKEDKKNVSTSETYAVPEPVSIQSSTATDKVENPECIAKNSSPSHRGDSGMAMSSESDIDSSYESNNSSLQGSLDSTRHVFPDVTLVETGIQDMSEQKSSPLKDVQETSQQNDKTSQGTHMISHSIQTSLVCEGGIVFSKQVDIHQGIDSETQTSGARIDKTELQSSFVESQKEETRDEVTKMDPNSKVDKVHEIVRQLPVGTGLRYSINADMHEK